MKGIIFNLLEQLVTDEFGEETWEDLLEGARLEGVYTSVGSYPDEQLHVLVDGAATRLQMTTDDVVRWFGRNAMPLLAERYPDFFSPHRSTISFILTLNDVIHPEVRKLFPGAYAPQFDFADVTEDSVALGYHSYRGLCAFAEGLVEGAADHYRQSVTIEQTSCAHRGDDKCVLNCRFAGQTS